MIDLRKLMKYERPTKDRQRSLESDNRLADVFQALHLAHTESSLAKARPKVISVQINRPRPDGDRHCCALHRYNCECESDDGKQSQHQAEGTRSENMVSAYGTYTCALLLTILYCFYVNENADFKQNRLQ